MYQVHNRETGWHIFTEMSLVAFIGRLVTHYDYFRNMTVSVHGGARQDVHDWLERHLPPPDALPGTSTEYFVHTAARPSHRINPNSGSYYCALLTMIRRTREEREALVIQIYTYRLGDAHAHSHYIGAERFYVEFQSRLNALVREEREPRRASAQPA